MPPGSISNPNWFKPEAIVSKDGHGQFSDIQDAIDYVEAAFGKGLVGIRQGTYDVSKIVIPPNISIQGAGVYATILKLLDDIDDNVLEIEGSDHTENTFIRDLQIDGNKDHQTGGCGIEAHCKDLSVMNTKIKECYTDGILLHDNNCDIIGCRIEYIGDRGIRVNPEGETVVDVLITGCWVGHIGVTGISLEGTETYQILKPNIYGNNVGNVLGTYGIFLNETQRALIHGNIIQSGNYAVRVVDCGYSLIYGHLHWNQVTGGFSYTGNVNCRYRDCMNDAGQILDGNLF